MRYKSSVKRLILACSVGLSVVAPWATAVDKDVLETQAMETGLAPDTLLLDVATAGSRLVTVGQRGHIIYSDDEGKTWLQAEVPVATLMTAVTFADDQNGWAVGHGAVILKSTDGGATWVKQFDGNLANEMVIAQAQKRVDDLERLLESAGEDTVADLEAQLEEAQFALEDAEFDAEVGPSKPLLDVWFKDNQTGFSVGAYGFFFKTEDGGENWVNWGARLDNVERFHLNAINQVTGGALFIVGEAGNIFRSTDLGETWELLDSPLTAPSSG